MQPFRAVAIVAVPMLFVACAAGSDEGGSNATGGTQYSDGGRRSDAGTLSRDGAIARDGASAGDSAPGGDGATGTRDSGSGTGGGCPVDAGADSVIPTGCACVSGATHACYPGAASTLGVGVCHAGTQTCDGASEIGDWSACTGAVVPSAEICGNQLDDDCDGVVDNGCMTTCITTGAGAAWQMWRSPAPVCFGTTFTRHGDPGEYALSSIPSESDPGWTPDADPTIGFDDMSRLCGVCDCLAGGDYTYFQTVIDIPPGYVISEFAISIGWVDDGVRATVFNSANPSGVTDPGSYAYLGGGSTTDLARYIVPGHNRIVLTHIDDCCSVRGMRDVSIRINGSNLAPCR